MGVEHRQQRDPAAARGELGRDLVGHRATERPADQLDRPLRREARHLVGVPMHGVGERHRRGAGFLQSR
jgi:hypothetical protein